MVSSREYIEINSLEFQCGLSVKHIYDIVLTA